MPLSLPNKDKKKKKIDEVEERLSPKKVSDLSFSEARAIREQYGSLKNYELATDKNRAKRIDEQMQDLNARRLVDAATSRGTPVEAESYGKNNKWNDYATVMGERKSDYDRAVEKLKKDLDVYSPIADVSGAKNYLDATKAGYEYPAAFGKAMAERGAQFKNENAYRTEVRNAEAGWGDKYRDTADQSSEGANSRWEIYQDNKRRIEELKKERDGLKAKEAEAAAEEEQRRYASVAPGVDPRRSAPRGRQSVYDGTPAKQTESDRITAEIDRLEAENRQYENTQMPTDRAVRSVVMSRDANAKLLGDLYDVDTIGDVREGDYEKYYNSSPLIRWMVAKEDPNQETYKFDRDWQDEYGLVDSYANYEYLTDEEKSTYFEMLHTAEAQAEAEREAGVSEKEIQKRYDQAVKDANYYIDELEIPLAARREKEAQEYRENAGTLGNVVGSILSVPLNLVGGAAAFLDDMGNLVQGKKINPYSVYHAPLNFASGERSATAEDIVAGTKNFNILGFNLGDTYQALMSAADSVAGGLLFGRAYTITMGMGASAARARELFENGASNGDIFASALTSGIVEAVTEYVSIDKFLSNFLESSPINKRDIILKVLAQGGVEASEEFAADILNAIQDEAILGTQSEWSKKINELVDGGMSKDEAGRKVFFETIGEALKSAAGGFISGVAMAGGAGVVQGVQLRNDIRNEGNYIIGSEGVEALRNIANEMTDAPKSISKLIEKTGKKPTAKNVGRLSRAVEQNVAKNADAENRLVQGAKYTLAREGVDLSDVKAREGTNLYNNVDVSEKISDTGTTVDTETGGEITIDETNPITQRDGKTYLNTSAGEILQDDIKYSSEKEAQLYEYVSDLPQSVANAIVENYKGQENVRGYVNGMRDGILLYGYNNIENAPKNTAFATLSKADQQYALKAGRLLAAEDLNNAKPQTVGNHVAVKETATTSGERVMNLSEIGLKATPAVAKKIGAGGTAGAVYTKGDVDLNSAMGRADGLLAYVYSSIAGNSVVLYDSKTVKDADLKNANGKHVASDGTIYLDVRAEAGNNVTGGIAYTLGHELTHEAEQWAKKEYAAFRKFLYENYMEVSGKTKWTVEDLIAKKMSDLDTADRAYAESELVADACERMLLDSDAMEKLAELRDKEPGTFKKIVDFIKRALEKIVGKFNSIREVYETMGAENTRIESKLVQEFGDNLKKLQDMWSDMVVKAAQNRAAAVEAKQTAEKKGTQYSRKVTLEENARYMELAKDPVKNEAELQRMVDEAAVANGAMTLTGGKRKPYYHGSSARFTTFDIDLARDGTYGYGFYFSPMKSKASEYGDVITAYLMTDRVATRNDHRITADQLSEIMRKYDLPEYALPAPAQEWIKNLDDVSILTRLQDFLKAYTNAKPSDFLRQFRETFGYDGLRSANETVIWDNHLIKSADPVTYDDQGNIIPLSERFNKNNDDIRYSRKISAEESKHYLGLAKDPQKNETQLREMVRDAATKAGYDSPMLYHGTNAFGFTIPKGYLFATDSEETAGTYSGTKSARNISEQTESNLGMYQLYANADGMLELDANGAETNHIALGDVESDFNNSQAAKSWHQFATINQIIKYAKENGYTGVIVKNVVDSATPESRKITSPATDYVFFSPQSQVKSADPVVYDDNGKVIPLEERFNPENDDIRYSRKSAQEKWDAGEKLTESQFYNFYSAHKLNLRGLSNVQEQIENIKSEGFKGDAGFGHNLMPTRQNTKYPTIDKYNTMLELEKEGIYEKGYADKWKAEQGEEFGKPVPSNISEAKYGPHKGDYILLVAKPGAEITKNVDRVREGYKPKFDYEIVQADYDYQPYYEMYSKAYDAAHDQFSRKSSESYAVRDIVDRALKRLDPSSAEYRAMAKYKAELDTLDNMRAQLDEAIKSGDRQAQTRLTNNIKTQRGILNRIENSASMKNVASMRDVTRLADDAKKLREMLKLQSRETNGTIAKQRSVNAAASEIMEKYGIKRGKGELAELLGNYYTKMMQSVNNETMTREAALDQAREAAEWIARHVPDEIQYDDGAIEALDMLRGYKVKLNDNQRQNIRAKYDDINGWRRAVGGYITLSNEGKYLDELWPEWAERAPGYFTNEMISDADMPERLAEIIDSLKKSRETVIEVPGQYEYDLERAANDVYEAFWNIEPEQTVADKYAERIKTLKAEHNAMMSDLRKSFRDTIREERSEMYAEAKERAREYNEKLDLRRKVRKIKDDLTKRLDKPTIKKFVPKELRTATSELLSALNLVNEKNQPSQRTLERIAKLQAIYDSYKDENIVYDKQVSEWLSELRDTVGNKSISELTKDELKSVYKILKAFTKNITEVAQVKSLYASGVSTEKTVDVVAKEWMRNIERINPALSAYFNTMGKLLGRPELVFRIFGNMDRNSISTKVYDMMNAAQLEYNRIRQEGNRLFEEMFEGKENEKYLKELHDTKKLYDIGLKDTNGEPVKVTKDFALWLYRILMNENGIKHVSTTGGVMPDFEKYYNGGEAYGKKATRVVGFLTDKANDILDEVKEKSADIDEQIEQAKSEGDYGRVKELWKERDNIWSAWDQVRNDGREALLDTVQKKISDILTPQDKRFLELAAKFYDEWSKGYMNKASNERHGIDIADEENYTRIHTAEDYRGATLDSSNMESAIGTENMGFTKRRVGATNPIYFEGLSSAIAKHIDEVATYAAYLNPLYDLRKILNYTEGGINKSGTVRSKLNEKFGKGATNYIYRLAANVKGESFDKFGNVGFEKVFDELLGRVAEAALVANGRVVAYQVVSLLNAVTELGYGPVAHTVVAKLLKRADAELIAKYTPILEVRRSNGGTDEVANMKNAAKNHSIWYKITYPGTHAIQAMDLATVGKLWYASEYYVKKHNKSLKPGSEEFYRAVGKKMTEVVELTQPNYTPMQRNQLQRSKNPLARALAMFKTQPFQNLNNAIGASFQFAHDIAGVKNKTATVAEARESGAKLYRSISSLVISSAMMAVINAAWISLLLHGHWRWRDDETGEVSWEKFGEWFADEALNRLFGTDPLTSEAYNFIGSKIFDRKYYPGVSMPQVEVVTDALQSLSDSVDAMIDKKWNPKKEGREMATKIGRLFGIPVDSIAKPIEGVYMNVQDIINGEFGSFNYGNEYKSKQLAAQMLLALETDDEEKYEKARSKFPGTKTQTPEEQADAALKKAIGDMYIQGQYTYDETKEMLEEYLDKEEKEAEKQIDRWDYAKVHGNQDGYTVDWRDK